MGDFYMSMFYLKSERSISIYAPCDGVVVSDEKFAPVFFTSGTGVAILPCSTILHSPLKGVLRYISNDLTTYIIQGTNGAKMLLKIGDNRLHGDGLHTLADIGKCITPEDCICSFDPAVFEQNQIPQIVTVRLLNPERFRAITVFKRECRASVTEVMNFTEEAQGYRLHKI